MFATMLSSNLGLHLTQPVSSWQATSSNSSTQYGTAMPTKYYKNLHVRPHEEGELEGMR